MKDEDLSDVEKAYILEHPELDTVVLSKQMRRPISIVAEYRLLYDTTFFDIHRPPKKEKLHKKEPSFRTLVERTIQSYEKCEQKYGWVIPDWIKICKRELELLEDEERLTVSSNKSRGHST